MPLRPDADRQAPKDAGLPRLRHWLVALVILVALHVVGPWFTIML